MKKKASKIRHTKANTKKSRKVKSFRVDSARKNYNPEKELAKALTDLNKIFTQKQLAKKFKIKSWQVSKYKKYKKRKSLPPTQRGKILRFYRKLQANRHGEDLRYFYKVTGKKRRLESSIKLPTTEINELAKRIGVKKLAKKLGVKPATIRQWKLGRSKITAAKRNKVYELYKKSVKKLVGIFLLSEKFLPQGKKKRKSYSVMKYYKTFLGDEEEFRIYVEDQEYFGLEDSLISPKKKFGESKAANFLSHLAEVKRNSDRGLIMKSIEESKYFINDNFSGEKRKRLLKILKKYEG